MTFRVTTLITAGLLGALLLVGSLSPLHAGDRCGKDKADSSTTGLTMPTGIADFRAV